MRTDRTPPHISEQLVGHRPPSIVRIYDPSDPWAWYAEKREAIESWGDEIERLASELKAQQNRELRDREDRGVELYSAGDG
jgi:hypothetical protein